jgi:ribonuclease BN (tRNA processing enzyme)
MVVASGRLDSLRTARLVWRVLRLRVLGSGDAFNSSGALHSCYVLEGGKGTLMLECGPSVLAAMKRAALDTASPDAILVSHLHGDHFGGIPFLFLEYKFKNPRTRPLQIAGPPGTEERVNDLYRALYADLCSRETSFAIEYVTVKPGSRLSLAGLEVEAFEVPHSAQPFCLGYRITGGGGALMFSGDSSWTEAFVRNSRGADVFLCECCSLEPDAPVHTCYRDIVAHRTELDCKRLVLTHLGEDVRASNRVDVERAYDGMVIEIGR